MKRRLKAVSWVSEVKTSLEKRGNIKTKFTPENRKFVALGGGLRQAPCGCSSSAGPCDPGLAAAAWKLPVGEGRLQGARLEQAEGIFRSDPTPANGMYLLASRASCLALYSTTSAGTSVGGIH